MPEFIIKMRRVFRGQWQPSIRKLHIVIYFVQLRIAKVKPSRKVPLISTWFILCGNMKENGQNVWIKKGDLKINTTGNKVFSGDEEISLTETEYEILSLMLKYRGKIFSVQNIYESVWQEPFFNNSANTVMVHIRKLRLKIEKNPQKPQIIQTVWGKGWVIVGVALMCLVIFRPQGLLGDRKELAFHA